MKLLLPFALGLLAIASVQFLSAEPVQPPFQPPSSLPPSSLPPGAPAPAPTPGITIGRKTHETESEITNSDTRRDEPAIREAEKIKSLASTSKSFATAAAQDGMLEVELGKLAASKGSNQQIKDFGKHMAADHEKSNLELKKVAKTASVTLPSELDADHHAKLDELKGKSSSRFDAAYAETMAKAHEMALALFREASIASGVDPGLQAFAKRTLPTLEEHSSTAKQLHAGLSAISPSSKI